MKNHQTIGDYYASLFESHLNAAIQEKLDTTSGFKKKMAGIETIDDAKARGYAPSNAQIAQIRECVKRHANEKYYQPSFHHIPSHEAIAHLVALLEKEIGVLNAQWAKQKLFSFDKIDLDDLAKEATEIITGEHDEATRHFFS